MSAQRRRRKAIQRRNAWICREVGCSRPLRCSDEIESGMCLSHLFGGVSPETYHKAVAR